MNPTSAGKLMFEQKSLLKWRKQWKNEQQTQTIRDFLLADDEVVEPTEQPEQPAPDKKTRNRLQKRSTRKKRS